MKLFRSLLISFLVKIQAERLCRLLGLRPHKLYESIDTLPVFNWMQVQSKGEIEQLIQVRGDYHMGIVKHWHTLYDDFIARFGLGKEFETLLDKQKQSVILRGELAETPNAVKKIKLDMLMAEMETYGSKKPKMDFHAALAAMGSHFKYRIDPHTMTVAEYYGHCALMTKSNERVIGN